MILEVQRDPKYAKITQNPLKTPPTTLPSQKVFSDHDFFAFWINFDSQVLPQEPPEYPTNAPRAPRAPSETSREAPESPRGRFGSLRGRFGRLRGRFWSLRGRFWSLRALILVPILHKPGPKAQNVKIQKNAKDFPCFEQRIH